MIRPLLCMREFSCMYSYICMPVCLYVYVYCTCTKIFLSYIIFFRSFKSFSGLLLRRILFTGLSLIQISLIVMHLGKFGRLCIWGVPAVVTSFAGAWALDSCSNRRSLPLPSL